MKNQPLFIIPILIACFIAFSPFESEAGMYEQLFADIEPENNYAEALLEVGAQPFPPPSRRQVRDAKGEVCLMCHRLPYPTSHKKDKRTGKMVLSSIPQVHPGGWRLLTPHPHPFIKK